MIDTDSNGGGSFYCSPNKLTDCGGSPGGETTVDKILKVKDKYETPSPSNGNPLLNFGIESDSKTIYYSHYPGSEFEIRSGMTLEYSNGSPYTLWFASDGLYMDKTRVDADHGFSLHTSSKGDFAYEQSALGNWLNDKILNSSSGLGFNPMSSEVQINLSVQAGAWNVSNSLSIKATNHPEEAAVVGAIGVAATFTEFLMPILGGIGSRFGDPLLQGVIR